MHSSYRISVLLALAPLAVAVGCQPTEEFHRIGDTYHPGSGGAVDGGGDSAGSGGKGGSAGSGGNKGSGGGGGQVTGSGGTYTCGSNCKVQVSYMPNGTSTSTIDGKISVQWAGSISDQAPLTSITVRYWFTGPSLDPTAVTFKSYYSKMGATSITGKFAEAIPLRDKANAYLEIGFAADWPSGYDTGEVQFQISGSNGYQFNTTGDYSYMAATTWTPNPNITAYVGTTLVWGVEPAKL